jgi:uncharacterized delta-60 repeat protein
MNNISRPGDLEQRSGNDGTEAVAGSGDLDPDFGDSGRATVPFRGFSQPTADGKYWTVARRESPPARLEIRRLLENGTQDPSFPLSGTIVDLYVGAKDFELFAVQRQSSGKLITGGRLFLANGTTVPLFARLGLDGLLDPSFGQNGIKLIDFDDDAPTRYFYAIDIQSDDKIVASTLSQIGSQIFPRIVRLNADGAQDASFGRNGVVYDNPQGTIFLTAAVLGDGKLLFGGMSETNGDAVLMRLQTNGILDKDFGEDGFAYFRHPDYPGMRANGITLSRRGDSVIVGGFANTPDISGWLARVRSDGTLDENFHKGELLFLNNCPIYRVMTQDDEKTVFHGSSIVGSQRQAAIGRVNYDGSLDAAFGVDGIAITPRPAQAAYSNAFSYSKIQAERLFVSDTIHLDTFQIQLLRYLLS